MRACCRPCGPSAPSTPRCFQEAADLAGEVRPRLTIPGHWDMFAGNSADPAAFGDYLDAKYPGLVPWLIPERGRMIRIGRV